MRCFVCNGVLDDLPSGDAILRGCKTCHCIWVYTKDNARIRRLGADERPVLKDGRYYINLHEKRIFTKEFESKVEAAAVRQRVMGENAGFVRENNKTMALDCFYRVHGSYCDAPGRNLKFCNRSDEEYCDDAIR